jgi:hypothetical protein
MLLLCWNVAAWGTTLPQIRTHYKSLGAYLDRHGADIFCIQARARRVLRACAARTPLALQLACAVCCALARRAVQRRTRLCPRVCPKRLTNDVRVRRR